MIMLVQAIYSLSACIVLSLCVYVLHDVSLFAWHPFFMSLGFLSFMTMGVVRSVTFRPLEGKTRTKAIQVHALLQALALSCAFAGLAAIVQNKVYRSSSTAHRLEGSSVEHNRVMQCKCTGETQQAAFGECPCKGAC